ncbi:MAG: hypothetical protein PWP10_3343 [Clostridiales bacterium]|jgi:NOL1/NOP2/sun family putative RNA methylase|nr:hypothetical protein [Clostridiales bacterium]
MSLPQAFIDEMKTLWESFTVPGSFTDFLFSFDQPQSRGLRANGLKISVSELRNLLQRDYGGQIDAGAMVPWNNDGFYIDQNAAAGRLPAYHAGLFYIQEPSAMLPAYVLNAQPGEKILDLCAAPGGKTAKIASDLQGQGLLWSNEISADRARALLRNTELMGCANSIISQETPERLADALPCFFDRVLVDAPCSGSGMFRRDNQAVSSWEKYGVEHCTVMQKDILMSADILLRPGGILVYSTCSFSLAEDEEMIKWFIDHHPEYELLTINHEGLSSGVAVNGVEALTRTVRIWPHESAGDGHFCALLRKSDSAAIVNNTIDNRFASLKTGKSNKNKQLAEAIISWKSWSKQILSELGHQKMDKYFSEWIPRIHDQNFYLMPPETPAFAGIKLVKTGMYLGRFKAVGAKVLKNRQGNMNVSKTNKNHSGTIVFEPSQAWVLSMKAEDYAFQLSLSVDDDRLFRYLRGETINVEFEHIIRNTDSELASGASVVVCYDKYPLGYARLQQFGSLKNMYPPAWRLRS